MTHVYGFQKGVDLRFLIGKEICQVAIGSHDVQLNWETVAFLFGTGSFIDLPAARRSFTGPGTTSKPKSQLGPSDS